MANALAGVEILARGVGNFVGNMNNAARAVERYGQSSRRASLSIASSSKTAGGSIASLAGAPSAALKSMSRQLVQLGDGVKRVGYAATHAGFGLSALFSAPIAGGLLSATKAAASFETELIKINTQVGLGIDSIRGMGREILNLAPAVGATADELAGGLFFITSRGIRDAATAMDILESSAKASAIGLGTTADVASSVTTAMIAYASSGITAERATDILLATVNRGAVEAEDLSTSFGKVLGLTSALGVSMEEAASFVATYTLAGVTASEATTSLERTLLSLVKPTDKANEQLAKLGTSGQQLAEQVKSDGLTNTLISLRKALDEAGIGAEQVFSRTPALRAFLFATGDAAKIYAQNTAEIINSNGLLNQSFETVSKTTGFQLMQVKAAMNVTAVTIGSVLLPAINALIQRLLPMLGAFQQWAATHPQLVKIAVGIGLVVAAIGPLLLASGLLISSIGSLISLFGVFVGFIGSLIGPIGLVVTAVLGFAAAIGISLVAGAQKAVGGAKNLAQVFNNIAKRAYKWGINITLQLAKGIIAAATYVVQALAQLGRIISNWLAPGSPPKLLPDLPEWGASAMSEFVRGFANADFSTFGSITDVIGRLFRSQSQGDDIDLIPRILNFQESLAQVTNAVRESGAVSDEYIRNIVRGLGLAGGTLEDFVTSMLRLRAVTEQVNRLQGQLDFVNNAFDERENAINRELQSIQARRDAVKESQRVGELNAILSDENAPELAKELALMELREIELNKQLRQEKERRDLVTGGIKDELAIAQENQARLEAEAQAQQDLIDLQSDRNDLIKEQIALLERLADAADSGGGGGAGSAPDLGDSLKDLPGIGVDDIVGDLDLEDLLNNNIFDTIFGDSNQKKALSQGSAIKNLLSELSAPVSGLVSEWDKLGEAWSRVSGDILNGAPVVQEKLQGLFDSLANTKIGGIIGDMLSEGAGFFTNIAAGFTAIADGDFTGAGEAIARALLNAIGYQVANAELILAAFGGLVDGIVTWASSQDWGQVADNIIDGITGFFSTLWDVARPHFETFVSSISTWFAERKEAAIGWAKDNIVQPIMDGIETLIELAEPFFTIDVFGAIQDWLYGLDWYTIGYEAMTFLLTGLETIGRFATETLPLWFAQVGLWWIGKSLEIIEWGEKAALKLLVGLLNIDKFFNENLPLWFASVSTWFKDKGPEFLALGSALIDQIISGIDIKYDALVDAIKRLANGIRDAWNNFWNGNQLNPPDVPQPTGGGPPGGGGSNTSDAAQSYRNFGQTATTVAAPSVVNNVTLSFGDVLVRDQGEFQQFEEKVRQIVLDTISGR